MRGPPEQEKAPEIAQTIRGAKSESLRSGLTDKQAGAPADVNFRLAGISRSVNAWVSKALEAQRARIGAFASRARPMRSSLCDG